MLKDIMKKRKEHNFQKVLSDYHYHNREGIIFMLHQLSSVFIHSIRLIYSFSSNWSTLNDCKKVHTSPNEKRIQ